MIQGYIMKIVEPSVELVWCTPNPLEVIELAGRTAYKSEDKITIGSALTFVMKIITLGHHSVLEHASMSWKITCDRGVSHEIVRHRLASYTQESTRYCNYSRDKFDSGICVIKPPGLNHSTYAEWLRTVSKCEETYLELIASGVTPQIARSILPNCLKTEIVMTANFREWRHFFKLRTGKAAHPQMQEIANMILNKSKQLIPSVFENL